MGANQGNKRDSIFLRSQVHERFGCRKLEPRAGVLGTQDDVGAVDARPDLLVTGLQDLAAIITVRRESPVAFAMG